MLKSEEIKALFAQFEQASAEIEGVECWSARELQKLLGYTQWRNFENIIDKARESCKNAGESAAYHFADVSKVIEAGKGAQHEIDDNDWIRGFDTRLLQTMKQDIMGVVGRTTM